MIDYITARRIEIRLRRQARERGLRGDPLADVGAVADTAAGQLAAVGLWLALPEDLRRHPAAWDMTRRTAYGRVA